MRAAAEGDGRKTRHLSHYTGEDNYPRVVKFRYFIAYHLKCPPRANFVRNGPLVCYIYTVNRRIRKNQLKTCLVGNLTIYPIAKSKQSEKPAPSSLGIFALSKFRHHTGISH